ncbi:MAG TPA: hypothetical protein DIU49_02735 [Desulfovibrio sp.]|nr:hypothetical protein [Desulfovibrio sp.]
MTRTPATRCSASTARRNSPCIWPRSARSRPREKSHEEGGAFRVSRRYFLFRPRAVKRPGIPGERLRGQGGAGGRGDQTRGRAGQGGQPHAWAVRADEIPGAFRRRLPRLLASARQPGSGRCRGLCAPRRYARPPRHGPLHRRRLHRPHLLTSPSPFKGVRGGLSPPGRRRPLLLSPSLPPPNRISRR